MSGLTKKTVKTKQRKPAKRGSTTSPALETPVLFRLPDLTTSPAPVGSLQLDYSSSPIVIGAPPPSRDPSPPSPKQEKQPASERPPLSHRSLLFVKHFLAPVTRKAVRSAGRVILLPYVGPASLVCASLLLTLGVIYNPFGGAPKTTTASQDGAPATNSKSPTASAITSDAGAASRHDDLQLKKIANQLDEQLLAQEPVEESSPVDASESAKSHVAVAVDDDADLADEVADAGSFTEPWSRKKPSPQVEVARADLESEETWANKANARGQVIPEDGEEESQPRNRTAQRPRNRRVDPVEDMDIEEEIPLENEEVEEPISPRSRRSSRYGDDHPIQRKSQEDRSTTDDEPMADEADLEAASQSPWQRIRNERLEREPNREELVGKPQPPKAKGKTEYRSPPGQEIELDPEWFSETASRPRGETKRTGPR